MAIEHPGRFSWEQYGNNMGKYAEIIINGGFPATFDFS
jgi:hypothetical protein